MYEVEEIEESIGRECAKDINAIFKYTSAKNNIGLEVKINYFNLINLSNFLLITFYNLCISFKFYIFTFTLGNFHCYR
jgi:hypothetical protein